LTNRTKRLIRSLVMSYEARDTTLFHRLMEEAKATFPPSEVKYSSQSLLWFRRPSGPQPGDETTASKLPRMIPAHALWGPKHLNPHAPEFFPTLLRAQRPRLGDQEVKVQEQQEPQLQELPQPRPQMSCEVVVGPPTPALARTVAKLAALDLSSPTPPAVVARTEIAGPGNPMGAKLGRDLALGILACAARDRKGGPGGPGGR